MRVQALTHVPTMVAMAAVISIAACGKQGDERTVGQKIDSAVAKVEQKTDSVMAKAEQKTDVAVAKVEQKTEQAVAAVKSSVASAENSGAKMADAAKTKIKDATITTSINGELARDSFASALKINVDTNDGRVALKGTVPDAAARERAAMLAQRVDGVVGVDNQLVVRSN